MVKSEMIMLVVGGVKLKAFSVHKWEDIVSDLLRLFPELGLEGARQGFRYKGAFGREKVVNDEYTECLLSPFFYSFYYEADMREHLGSWVQLARKAWPELSMYSSHFDIITLKIFHKF